MKEYLKLAWRNIWRNKRRTLITAASIFFAMFFAVIMRSFQLGSYTNMINSVIESYSGHLQIQQKDYFKDPNINNSMAFSEDLRKIIEDDEKIVSYDARLQSGLLASSGESSKIGFVLGVNPQKANELTKIAEKIVNIHVSEKAIEKLKKTDVSDKDRSDFDKIIEKIEKLEGKYFKDFIDLNYELKLTGKKLKQFSSIIEEALNLEGEYLSQNDNSVVIGFRLATFLNLQVGDSIIVMGQGYHGASAVGKYRIKGFLKFPSLDFNNTAIYMTLKNAQNLLAAYQVADNMTDTTFYVNFIAINTSEKITIKANSDKKINTVVGELETAINDENLSVVFWKKSNKALVQQIESDNVSGQMMVFILYLIIAFGVFGTVLMMVAERKRELGVMIAIGMKKFKLAIIVTLEMIFIGLLGVVSGGVAAAPMILLGHYFPARLTGEMAEAMEQFNVEPVMPMELFDTYFFNQAIVVLFIVLVTMIYPIIKILRMNVINAIRN